jgi:hypothetical protein
MKCLACMAAVLAFLPFAAAAQDLDPQGLDLDASQCDVRGFSADPDPAGTNVRSAPNASAPIIGHLPARHTDPKTGITARPEFHVTGSKEGWLRIENATGADAGGAATISFKGPGWISGSIASFTIGDRKLYRAPSTNSFIVTTLGGKDFGPESYRVTRVDGCMDTFVDLYVQILHHGRVNGPLIQGWASSVCASRLTTCGIGKAH